MKLPNNYISEGSKTHNFRKTFRNNDTGVAFSQTHDNDNNEKYIPTVRYRPIYPNSQHNIIGHHHALNWTMNNVDNSIS